jgi:hypothetical protein
MSHLLCRRLTSVLFIQWFRTPKVLFDNNGEATLFLVVLNKEFHSFPANLFETNSISTLIKYDHEVIIAFSLWINSHREAVKIYLLLDFSKGLFCCIKDN